MAQFYVVKQRETVRKRMTVTIDDLDAFGQGVARHQGKTIFVTGALPGERAEIHLLEEKKHFARAQTIKIEQPGPDRVIPRCPHFDTCGGCQQQHVSAGLQQRSKARALARLLSRQTGQPAEVSDLVVGREWGYRRRARFGLHWSSSKRHLKMGFRQSGSHDLVEVTQCPVLVPELETLLPGLRDCLARLQTVRRPGHVELIQADNGPLLLLRHLGALSASDRQKLEQFSHCADVTLWLADDDGNLRQVRGELPWYSVNGLKLTFSPQDFIQVNSTVNQQMVAKALEWLDLHPRDRLLDLFCGMGNFTLPAARVTQNVVGVEGVATLVEQATYNARLNNLKNVTFYQHNLENAFTKQSWAQQGFNKILLDPARTGAAGIMGHIAGLDAQRVVYVSCNPTTLARDSQTLLAAGYRLERVAMLDMFPHTSHLESMVLFSKK